MDYKNDLKKLLSDDNILIEIRYNSAKNIFVWSALLFFLNYFFVWAKFIDSFFKYTLIYTYSIFIFSFFMYIYYFLKNTFDFKKVVNIIITILLILSWILLIIPFFNFTI